MSTRMQTLGSWTLLLPTLVLADWHESYRKGEGLLEQGRPAEAIKELSLALREAQSDQTGQSEVGVILDSLGGAEFRLGRYRSARHYLEMAVAFEGRPNDQAASMANLALVCQAMGDFAKAEQLYRQAMAALPNCPQLWHQLGQTLFLRRRLDEADTAHRRAVELAGENEPKIAALAWSDLSALYTEKKNYTQAAQMLEKAISLTPPGAPHAVMVSNKALLQMKMGQSEQAVRSFADSLAEIEMALGPDHPRVSEILEFYADALRQAKRKAEAKVMLKRAESIRSVFSAQTNSGRATVDWRDLR